MDVRKKEVSVIVPIYNVENCLEKCLESLQRQSFSSFEVILIDDGSTDQSRMIAEKYVEDYPHLFCLICQENQGLSEARNTGMANANGKYLCFVDSDDYVEVDYLQKMYQCMTETGVDLVFSAFRSVDEQGNCIKNVFETNFESKIPYQVKDRKEVLLIQNAAWNKMYKKQIIEDHQLKFTKGAWYEDLRFVKKYLLLISSFAYCDSILYNYLIRKGSIMNSMGSKRNMEIIGALDEVIDFYTENHVINLYQEEIEFLAIDHVYISTLVRLIRSGEKEQFGVVRNWFLERFPNYKKNKYIANLEKNRKLIYGLMNYKLYGIIRMIFKVKEK